MGYLTLGWLTLLELPPADVITAAAEGGFKSVSIRITGRKLTDAHTQVVGNRAMIREIRRRLEDGGLRLSNTSTYHLSPDVTLSDLLPVIETTAELGAETIVTTCTDPDEARWVAFVVKYCEAAAKFGLKLALEFVPFSQAKTLEQGDRIVRQAAQPNFGLLIDALHLARSGGTPAALAKVEARRIFFAQICDAPREKPAAMDLATEARTGRLYPGEGELPLYDLLDALPADIEIECEVPHRAFAHLSAGEQAAHAGNACRRFLETYRRRRNLTARPA